MTRYTHSAPDAVLDLLTLIDARGRFQQLVPTFPPAFGYTSGDLLHKQLITFIHPADHGVTRAALQKLARHEPVAGFENRFRCSNDSFRRLQWTALPTPDGMLCAVARQIDSATPPRKAPRRADNTTRAEIFHPDENFVAVCHDLQQPLTVILAQAQLVERQLARGESGDTERLAARIAHIVSAAARMRGMAESLLDSSVQASGRPLDLVLAPTDLVQLLRQTVHEHELISDHHRFLFEPDRPFVEASIDERRMHRVIANLLMNAIKYSPAGSSIHIALSVVDGHRGPSATITVTDEGVGIPADDRAHIFERFQRATNVVGRFAGTGIGLSSARELVELMGGTIAVASQQGHGSTFSVNVPLGQPS